MQQQPGDKTWANGYSGQSVIIVNEAYDLHKQTPVLDYTLVKLMCEGDEFTLPDKGNNPVVARPTKLIFTSTVSPETWYLDGEGNPLEEWVRRVVDFGVFFCTSNPFIEPVGVRVKDMSPDTFWGRKAAEQSGRYAGWVREALAAGGAAAERAQAWVAADEAARGGGGVG